MGLNYPIIFTTMAREFDISYTLGFIRCEDNNKILLLNRNKPPWMGLYNGIGGKIQPNETPLECMIREANEETGLSLTHFTNRGVLTWEVDYSEKVTPQQPRTGGLYLFTADISLAQYENYRTPLVYNDEGILDWKDWVWIMHSNNLGVVDNVKIVLLYLFSSKEEDLFMVKYNDYNLINCVHYPGKNPLCQKSAAS